MLTREGQIGIKVEAAEGTEEVLVAADFAGNRKDGGHTYTPGVYERGLERGTLTKQTALAGEQLGTVRWTEECVGGAIATSPKWHEAVMGAGHAKDSTTLKYIEVINVTGTWLPGDTFGDAATLGTATHTGMVVYMEPATSVPRRLWYKPLLGVFTDGQDVWNYARAGAEADVDSAPAAGGWRMSPKSERDGSKPASCTVQRRLGGQIHVIVGARGTMSWTARQTEPLLLSFEYKGPQVFADPDTRAPRTGARMANVPVLSGAPRLTQGVRAYIVKADGTAVVTVLTSLECNLNNTLNPVPTINDNDIAGSGYRATEITDRGPTFTINPRHILAADGFDFIAAVCAHTEFRFFFQIGRPTDANGAVVFIARKCCFTGEYSPADTNGSVTNNLTGGMYGDDDDEYEIFHCFAQ